MSGRYVYKVNSRHDSNLVFASNILDAIRIHLEENELLGDNETSNVSAEYIGLESSLINMKNKGDL